MFLFIRQNLIIITQTFLIFSNGWKGWKNRCLRARLGFVQMSVFSILLAFTRSKYKRNIDIFAVKKTFAVIYQARSRRNYILAITNSRFASSTKVKPQSLSWTSHSHWSLSIHSITRIWVSSIWWNSIDIWHSIYINCLLHVIILRP